MNDEDPDFVMDGAVVIGGRLDMKPHANIQVSNCAICGVPKGLWNRIIFFPTVMRLVFQMYFRGGWKQW